MSIKLKLLNKLSDWIAARDGASMIRRDGQDYQLRHFLIHTKYFSMYLLKYYAPDDGASGLHCHPWHNISILLHGGFRELFHDGKIVERFPGAVVFRQDRVLHRIDSLMAPPGEVYSLFITFKRTRTWGFFKSSAWDEIFKKTGSNKVGWFLPKGKDEPLEEGDPTRRSM